jgi:hypothetical protein
MGDELRVNGKGGHRNKNILFIAVKSRAWLGGKDIVHSDGRKQRWHFPACVWGWGVGIPRAVLSHLQCVLMRG